MKKLNVVKVIDQWGWAYYFVDIEQQRYSKHNIIIQRFDNIDLKDVDVLYIHGPNIHYPTTVDLNGRCKRSGVRFIGGYGGFVEQTYPNADAIATISPETYFLARGKFKDLPVVFLPESVDTNYFISDIPFNKDRFNVGYAGSTLPLKRTNLFEYLRFPVIKKTDWGNQYFTENKTQEHMKEFYKSIDVLILLSTTECMPRVILEAMSMGLPVIATNVGCIRYLLEPMCIVDVRPDNEVVRQVNERLLFLSKNPSKRQEIGIRNRAHVAKYFSWQKTQPLWDYFFESVYENNREVLNNFPNYFANFS